MGEDLKTLIEDRPGGGTGEIEVAVIGEVEHGRRVGPRLIVDAQLPAGQEPVGNLHLEPAGKALLAVGAGISEDSAGAARLGQRLDLPDPGDEALAGAAVEGVGPVIGHEPDVAAVDRKAGASDPPGIAADDAAEEVARIPRLVGGEIGQAERDIVDPPRAVRRFDGGDDPAIIEEANDEAVVPAQDIFRTNSPSLVVP